MPNMSQPKLMTTTIENLPIKLQNLNNNPGGIPHMKGMGMLVGNFELNP